MTALQALTANAQLVELLVGRRWYVIQAATRSRRLVGGHRSCPGGHAQEAEDWYRDKIAHREQYVPDVHDSHSEPRAVLHGD